MQDDNKKPTVEDQELADMIASMNGGAPKTTPPAPPAPPAPVRPAQPIASPTFKPPVNQGAAPLQAPAKPTTPPAPVNNLPPKPAVPPAQTTPTPVSPKPLATPNPIVPAPNTDLDFIKKSAMDELRPLVGRLDLPAEEKFDTLLLLIRSTDDKTLLGPAHEAAQQITDEKKKAQALLDIVKEIDFFESSGK